MPDDQPTDAVPQDETAQAARLASARAELNRIDDAIHALLMERAQVVKTRVGNSGKSSPLRPGRQAAVIRRLLDKHQGALPAKNLVCLWLELMAGGTAIQGELTVAVCESDAQGGIGQITREYFGSLVPIHVHTSPGQALAEVSAGKAAIAVLPLPGEDDSPGASWWTALLQRDDPRIHIIARLPFWRARPAGASQAQALVVGRTPPDSSGEDRTLIGLDGNSELSRARLTSLFELAGLKPSAIVLRRDGAATRALVELSGWMEETDTRLAGLDPALGRPVVLGAYAVGLGDDA